MTQKSVMSQTRDSILFQCIHCSKNRYCLEYTVKSHLTVTSLLQTPFLAAQQNGHTVTCKKPSLIRSLVNTTKCFGSIGNRIDEVPLYYVRGCALYCLPEKIVTAYIITEIKQSKKKFTCTVACIGAFTTDNTDASCSNS